MVQQSASELVKRGDGGLKELAAFGELVDGAGGRGLQSTFVDRSRCLEAFEPEKWKSSLQRDS